MECHITNPVSNQTSWDTNRTAQFQFQNSLSKASYSRGNASSKAYRFQRLENARFVQATSLSRPTRLFIHRARRRLWANTFRRIKWFSGWYHPRRYRLQRFRTATDGCACTPNAKSRARRLLQILTKPASVDKICVTWRDRDSKEQTTWIK